MRVHLPISMLLAFALLSGCANEPLWKSEAVPDAYRERVSSVLISKDGKTLVVVGKDHHYIFDAPPAIVRTLTSDYQKYVTASFGEFSVDDSQRIEGRYALQITDDAPDDAKMKAWTSGFYRDARGRVRTEGVLSGKRYRAGNVKIAANARALNREYFVDVRAPRSGPSGLSALAPLTPIIVVGAAILLFSVALHGVGMPLMTVP